MKISSALVTVMEWIGFGLALWGISLFWPGINRINGWPAFLGLFLGLGMIIIRLLSDQRAKVQHPGNGASQNPISRPVQVTPIQ